jgi:hypothetical protein
VKDIWPEGASGIIAGRPKDGKSTLAAELALSLWSGTPMFGLDEFPVTAKPAAVLYVQQENATARQRRDFQELLAVKKLGQRVVVDYYSAEQMQAAGRGNEELVIEHFEIDDYADNLLPPFNLLSHAGVDLSIDDMRVRLQAEIEREEYKYVFLDPLYMLVGAVDEIKEPGQFKVVLGALSQIKNETGCGIILTHHLSDKGGERNSPSKLMSSTYLHAWYEAALFVHQQDKVFTVDVDAQRSHGEHLKHTLLGQGLGKWFYDAHAQDQKDVSGRSSPAKTAKELKLALYEQQLTEHPDWTRDDHAKALGVTEKTVRRYEKLLSERILPGTPLADRIWSKD